MTTLQASIRGVGVIIVSLAWLGSAHGFQLVTPDEAAHQGRPSRSRGVTVPPGTVPRIELISPTAAIVKAPVKIEIKFVPADSTAINPKSFRAYYGWLGLDITDRITEHAKVTPTGISVDDADLPPGEHRVLLQVSDAAQRKAEREFRFTVK